MTFNGLPICGDSKLFQVGPTHVPGIQREYLPGVRGYRNLVFTGEGVLRWQLTGRLFATYPDGLNLLICERQALIRAGRYVFISREGETFQGCELAEFYAIPPFHTVQIQGAVETPLVYAADVYAAIEQPFSACQPRKVAVGSRSR